MPTSTQSLYFGGVPTSNSAGRAKGLLSCGYLNKCSSLSVHSQKNDGISRECRKWSLPDCLITSAISALWLLRRDNLGE
jgi:hypothetical protein